MKTIFRPSSGTALAFGFCLGVAHAAPRLAPDKFVVLQLRQDEAFVIAVDSHPRAGQVSASDTYGALADRGSASPVCLQPVRCRQRRRNGQCDVG